MRALVVGDDDEVAYGELWDRAALTARGLQRLGVGRGDLARDRMVLVFIEL